MSRGCGSPCQRRRGYGRPLTGRRKHERPLEGGRGHIEHPHRIVGFTVVVSTGLYKRLRDESSGLLLAAVTTVVVDPFLGVLLLRGSNADVKAVVVVDITPATKVDVVTAVVVINPAVGGEGSTVLIETAAAAVVVVVLVVVTDHSVVLLNGNA